MSHKATAWAVQQRGISATAKVVLWHLCDRHNPEHGCFPSQELLASDCEVARSTLNRVMTQLERHGLIRRETGRDESGRQLPTRYYFPFESGFDISEPNIHVPESDTEPCPISAPSRVPKSDTNLVRVTSKDLMSEPTLFGEVLPPEKTDKDEIKAMFDLAWDSYPHNPSRRDKRGALIKWRVLCEGRDEVFPKVRPSKLVEAVQRYAASGPDIQYVPAMRRWLNEGRWESFEAPGTPKSKWRREAERMAAAERRAI